MENTKVMQMTIKQLLILPIIIIAILTTYIQVKNSKSTEISKDMESETQTIKTIGRQPVKRIRIETKSEMQMQTLAKREITYSQVTGRTSLTQRQKSEAKVEEVKVEVEEELIIEPIYKTIEEVTISKDMDLTQRTGLSKEDFKTLISRVKQDKTKFFYNNSDIIYDLCEEYQINEIFFCGLISAESGWEIVQSHRNTHNYISLMSKGKLIRYSTVEEGLRVAAQKLHDNYLSEDGKYYEGKTLEAVRTNFCPKTAKWTDLVYNGMEEIVD